MKFLQILCFNLASFSAFGQVLHRPSSYFLHSLTVYSSSFADVLGCGYNPAGLESIKTIQAGAFVERKFNRKELQSARLSFAFPINGSRIGITASYFGFSGFNQTEFMLAYGKKVGKVNIGAAFNYLALNIPGYTGTGEYETALGAMVHLTSKLTAGLLVMNPIAAQHVSIKPPMVYQFGFGYEVSGAALISFEITKEEEQSLEASAGIFYRPDLRFFFGAGIRLGTGSPFGEAGFQWKRIRIIVTASFHPQLGISDGIYFLFQPVDRSLQ